MVTRTGLGTSRGRRTRVLIAEDDDSLRMLMRIAIDIGGLDIVEACDGITALERRHRRGLCLVGRGLRARRCRRLRARHPHGRAGARLREVLPVQRSVEAQRLGGTGLGLALAHEIIVAHGGHMGFESTEGVGSRFWFTLPTE